MQRKSRELFLTHASVGLEDPGGSELSQLVTHHILGNVYVSESLSAVHHEGEPNEIWRNHGATAPSLYRLLITLLDRFVDFG